MTGGGPDLAALAGVVPGMRVLDVAAGRGRAAAAAVAAGARVVLVDRRERALAEVPPELASRTARVVADGVALPFRAETFDLVILRAAVHHLVEPLAVVREGARVLRQGGTMLLVDKVAPADACARALRNAVERLRHRGHTWTHSREGLAVLGTGARLEVDAVEEWTEAWEAGEWIARARTEPPWDRLVREMLEADAAAGGAALGTRREGERLLGEDRWAVLRLRRPPRVVRP